MTREEINTELDYALCDHFGCGIDELDALPLKYVKRLRAYMFWGAETLLNEEVTDFEYALEETAELLTTY
jgi:hypothetical protein